MKVHGFCLIDLVCQKAKPTYQCKDCPISQNPPWPHRTEPPLSRQAGRLHRLSKKRFKNGVKEEDCLSKV